MEIRRSAIHKQSLESQVRLTLVSNPKKPETLLQIEGDIVLVNRLEIHHEEEIYTIKMHQLSFSLERFAD